MSRLASLIVSFLVTVILLPSSILAQPSPPALLTVVANPAQRLLLVLEPGFNLFLAFDVPIDFVAVGDEKVVAVSVRGQDGIIGLQALSSAGRTNLHVQAGGVLVVFEVRIAKGPRTADVVRVLTQAAAAISSQPSKLPAPPTSPQVPSEKQQHRGTEPSPGPSKSAPLQGGNVEFLPNPVGFLTEEGMFRLQEVRERGVKAAFQAYRTSSGIEIRYELMNTSGLPWKVNASRVLVRADGRIVPAKILRHAPAPDGETLPHGSIETGVIVLLSGARNVELTFPLFHEVLDPRALPILFTVRFTDLQGLPEVKPR